MFSSLPDWPPRKNILYRKNSSENYGMKMNRGLESFLILQDYVYLYHPKVLGLKEILKFFRECRRWFTFNNPREF